MADQTRTEPHAAFVDLIDGTETPRTLLDPGGPSRANRRYEVPELLICVCFGRAEFQVCAVQTADQSESVARLGVDQSNGAMKIDAMESSHLVKGQRALGSQSPGAI